MKIQKVLVANRGEIALRIIRACQQLGIETVLIVSQADRDSLPAREADNAVCIGPAPAAGSYLQIGAIIAAAKGTGADALHPGYGFLAESPKLAEACVDAGLVFIGPPAQQILDMGNKLKAREMARGFGIPILPGSEKVHSYQEATELAETVGFPVMLKAAAGGGGKGMKIVQRPEQMRSMVESASAEAKAAFGDDTLYLERYIANARHVEVQVLGDTFGNVVHLGERDCSLQRRHQKLVEESPAPSMAQDLRLAIREAGVTLARKMGYVNAGTVEFILDEDEKEFYFLEMNTRIQVEHPVSEMVTGIDLVQEQIRVARGERLRFEQQDIVFRGHAIECRINAERPELGFQPSPGRIDTWVPPLGPNIRLDSHCFPGYTVPPHYDSMIGKLIVYGFDRDEALARMARALQRFRIEGVGTTLEFLAFVMADSDFASGRVNTMLVESMAQRFSAHKRSKHV